MSETKQDLTITISVRTLVEFILASGDITPSSGSLGDPEAMQAGSRLHRKIQNRAGSNYQAEVALSHSTPFSVDGLDFQVIVTGRADGVVSENHNIIIDEIKGIYGDIHKMTEPVPVHLAQAKCYAYFYSCKENLSHIGVRMTYGNLDTEEIRYMNSSYSFDELKLWYTELINEYSKWAYFLLTHRIERKSSIHGIEFPFPYRPGQKDLVKSVYLSILRGKKLFIEAPTGVGKTISTVFPAVKAVGEDLAEKIFYLTAKTITRTVAEETFAILEKEGAGLNSVTLTAKDKICIFEESNCDAALCPRAKGHFDRVNDCVFDLITHERQITRETILAYAEKYQVCPFEMSLDITLWTDVVICDYNYVFDPHVALKRFFSQEKRGEYIFLIDEAHNLVERGREMYSAELYKEDFLKIKGYFKEITDSVATHSEAFSTGAGTFPSDLLKTAKTVVRRLNTCNKDLLEYKRSCEDFLLLPHLDMFSLHLLNLVGNLEEILRENFVWEHRQEVLEFYFEVRSFLAIYELIDEKYTIFADFTDSGRFRVRLQCMDPSTNLASCLEKGRSTVYFSATLLPVNYYKEQLAGDQEDYAVYAPSPFPKENRLLMIGRDVSSRYRRRNDYEYQKIADYICNFVRAKAGNYLVFFPSYQMLNQVLSFVEQQVPENYQILVQGNSMREEEKEAFLASFTRDNTSGNTKLGFCVLGGIFGEGIDLKEDSLIGAVIVGTGLPMVCNEREHFRNYYEEVNGQGFEYAYLYPGMNKVLQAAGRVIRTDTDRGAILLLDDRFLQPAYQNLFPREWFPHDIINLEGMKERLQQFWGEE